MDYDISKKNFAGDSKKMRARQITAINRYRELFERDSIPKDSQYWTLCAKSGFKNESKKEGCLPNLIENCELDQILKQNLLKPHQFHGVEREFEIHKNNIFVKGPHWHYDDFLNAMKKARYEGNFNPSVVNYDSIHFPATFSEYTSQIFKLLTSSEIKNVLLVINMVLACRHARNAHRDDILLELLKNDSFKFSYKMAIRQGCPWEFDFACYQYNGTGKNTGTFMGTMEFYRREK